MTLDVSRKIVSTILEIVMAICTMVFLLTLIMTFTFADQNFFINQFATQQLADECNEQLNLNYEALSDETGIPARVYERVEEDFPTDEALRQAALSLFSEENETLYSENKINYFYELSVEYLEGNDISFKEDDVRRSAQKAARIYSDVVGIHNAGRIETRIAGLSKSLPKATIISFLIAFACFPVMMVMYKRKKGGYFKAIGGILAGAAATAVGLLLLIVFNIGGSIDILPEIYKASITHTAKIVFAMIIFVSLIVVAGSVSIMRFLDKKIQDED
jgi:hypothetical protein